MPLATHPGGFLKRELKARDLSANRFALDLSVPSGRVSMHSGREIFQQTAKVALSRYDAETASP